jgi:hypothetical protein
MLMDQAPDLMMAAAETPIQRGYLPVIGRIKSRRCGVNEAAVRAFDNFVVCSKARDRPEGISLARFAERAAIA